MFTKLGRYYWGIPPSHYLFDADSVLLNDFKKQDSLMQLEQLKIGLSKYRDYTSNITERLYNFFSRIALTTYIDKQALLIGNIYISYLPIPVKQLYYRKLTFI